MRTEGKSSQAMSPLLESRLTEIVGEVSVMGSWECCLVSLDNEVAAAVPPGRRNHSARDQKILHHEAPPPSHHPRHRPRHRDIRECPRKGRQAPRRLRRVSAQTQLETGHLDDYVGAIRCHTGDRGTHRSAAAMSDHLSSRIDT
eukprot:GFYU01063894.1.p3 GENE.GFYU01063894.1~~GFYU01063894.1.p3  ORF type:complete len:144 (-),score=12.83 GFYU01063894.1:26-457(-)